MCEANKGMVVPDYNLNDIMQKMEWNLHTAWMRFNSGNVFLYLLHGQDTEEHLESMDCVGYGDDSNVQALELDKLPWFFGVVGENIDDALAKLRAKLKGMDDANLPWNACMTLNGIAWKTIKAHHDHNQMAPFRNMMDVFRDHPWPQQMDVLIRIADDMRKMMDTYRR